MFIFRPLYTVVDGDPKLKALVTYTPDLRPNMSPVSTTQHNNLPGPSASPTPSAPSSALARKVRMLSFIRSGSVLPSAAFAGAKDVPTLKTLGETWGDSLQELCVVLDADYGFSASSKRIPPLRLDPALLAPFTAVTHITWQADHPKLSFTSIPEGFSALPNLKSMATIFESPALLAMGLRLPLNCLEDVDLDRSADVPTSVAFLRLHGPKLTRLSAPLEIIVKIDVFDLCTNLTHLAVLSPFPKSSTALPADFLSCSTPHTTILKIEFVFHRFTPQQASAFKEIFTNLDAADLPALKEIKVKGIEWPTSEHTVRKNKWIPLAKVLRSKGIKLTDTNGSSPRLDGLEVVA
ncbi:hypothetical protein C8R46DRAFT_1108435 [Mycena filopes]|nr:hypothetical protein C8R46DRAFT_1108435 [Mycena filopes]